PDTLRSHDQTFLYAENGVEIELGIAHNEQMRGDGRKPGGPADKVVMRGTKRLRTGCLGHFTNRTLIGDGIRRGLHGCERVAAVGFGSDDAAQVERRLVWILHVVESVGTALPYIERRSGDRLSVEVAHRSHNAHGFAAAILGDGGAH